MSDETQNGRVCAGDALAAPAVPRVLPDSALVRGAAGRHAERRTRLCGLLMGTRARGHKAALRLLVASRTQALVAAAAAARAQVACPAMTELEVHMMDWLARLLRLPRHFLFNPTPTPAETSADGKAEHLNQLGASKSKPSGNVHTFNTDSRHHLSSYCSHESLL